MLAVGRVQGDITAAPQGSSLLSNMRASPKTPTQCLPPPTEEPERHAPGLVALSLARQISGAIPDRKARIKTADNQGVCIAFLLAK